MQLCSPWRPRPCTARPTTGPAGLRTARTCRTLKKHKPQASNVPLQASTTKADELRGAKDWKDLLPTKDGKVKRVDSDLAQELIKYAELCKVTYMNCYPSTIDLGQDPTKEHPIPAMLRLFGLPISLGDIKKNLSVQMYDQTIRGLSANYLTIRWPAGLEGERGALANCLQSASDAAQEYEGIAEIYCYAGPNNIIKNIPEKEKWSLWGSSKAAFEEDEGEMKELMNLRAGAGAAGAAGTAASVARSAGQAVQVSPEDVEPKAPDTSQRAFWQGYVAVKKNKVTGEDEEIVFVYRGTQRADEWITNTRASYLVPYSDEGEGGPLRKVLVHLGYRNMYMETLAQAQEGLEYNLDKEPPKQMIEKLLWDRYISQNKPLPKITTTGHSLGAALCTFSAFHLACDLPNRLPPQYREQLLRPGAVACYPMASPRVGGEEFKKMLDRAQNVKILRTANDCDLVPRLPMPPWDPIAMAIKTWAGDALLPQEYKPKSASPSSRGFFMNLGLSAVGLPTTLPDGDSIPLTWACKVARAIGKPVGAEAQGALPQTGPGAGDGKLFGGGNEPEFLTGFLHVGQELRFCSNEEGQAPTHLRRGFPKYRAEGSGEVAFENVAAAMFTPHNIEVYAATLAKISQSPIERDYALLNSDGDNLDPQYAQEQQIPGGWWKPRTWIEDREDILTNQAVSAEGGVPALSASKPHKGMKLIKGEKVWRPWNDSNTNDTNGTHETNGDSSVTNGSNGGSAITDEASEITDNDQTGPAIGGPDGTAAGLPFPFQGHVSQPGDEDYPIKSEQYATTSHGEDGTMAPAAVLFPTGDEDVLAAIKYARENGLAIAVRTGGHQYSGASSTGGKNIQLDLGHTYKDFIWDEAAGMLTLGISRKLGDTNEALRGLDVFVPHGQCSHVHVGGHSHTGGYGMPGRAFGLFADHIMAIRVITADGRIRWINRYVKDPEDSDLFYAVLGGSPGGSFGVLTHIKLLVHRKDDHPNARGLTMFIPFTKKSFRELLSLKTEMVRKSENGELPADYDYCVTVMSLGEQGQDGYQAASRAMKAAEPVEGYATVEADVGGMGVLEKWGMSKEVSDAYEKAFAKQMTRAASSRTRSASSSSRTYQVIGPDDDEIKPAVIIVFANYANLEGPGQQYDPTWFKRMKDIAAVKNPAPDELKQINEFVGKGMPYLTSHYVFGIQREFLMPYNKRTYLTNARWQWGGDQSTAGWPGYTAVQVGSLLDKWGEGVRVAVQIQNYGGMQSRYRNNDPTNRTSYSWRRDTTVVCVMDAFYDPSMPNAKKLADQWQKENDLNLKTKLASCFSQDDRRVFWSTYCSKPEEKNLENSWQYYYDSKDKYERLKAIKKRVDPLNVFTPNPYALKA